MLYNSKSSHNRKNRIAGHYNNSHNFEKVMIMIRLLTATFSILLLTCIGGTQAFADYPDDGWPRFTGDVDMKWQRKDAQSFKLEAKLIKDADLTLQLANGSSMLPVADASYQLKSDFGIDGTFLGGSLKITGKIDPYTSLDQKPKSVLLTGTLYDFDWTENELVFGYTDIDCPWFDFCSTTNEYVRISLDNGGFDAGFLSKRFNDTGTAVTTIPIPAAVWLFGSGILGLASVARRKRKIT